MCNYRSPGLKISSSTAAENLYKGIAAESRLLESIVDQSEMVRHDVKALIQGYKDMLVGDLY